MTLKSDTKFGEESTCFKIDMRNLANFHQSTRKCQNWDFDGNLMKIYELKIYRRVMCHDNEECHDMNEEFDEFWLEHSKI